MRDIKNYKKWYEKNKDKIRIQKTEWARSENGRASQRAYRKKSSKAMRLLYIGSARKRKIKFDISQEQFDELIKQDCSYCGAGAINGRNGIDRMDNTKGYVIDNATPCCFKCNQMKGKLTIDEFIHHSLKIIEHAIK